MLKLIIFDLDNTLFDTYGQLGMHVLDQMIEKMKPAGLTDEQEKFLRERYIISGFRAVAQELNLPEEIRKAGIKVYENMDVSHITPFEDVKLIKNMKPIKVLVTSGIKAVQMKKVEFLGIKDYFKEIIVEEQSRTESKQKIFSEIIKKYKLKPKEILVVGDNEKSEIAIGNKLGMITVQILRRPFDRGKPDYFVKDLHEVKKILDERI